MAGIQQDNAIVKLIEKSIGLDDEFFIGDAAGHLLVKNDRVGRFQGMAQPGKDGIVGFGGAAVEKAKIDARFLLVLQVALGKGVGVKVLLLNNETGGVDIERC